MAATKIADRQQLTLGTTIYNGSAIIDFGDAPIKQTSASVIITGETNITATSKIFAYIMPEDLIVANGHSEDEHQIENLRFSIPKSSIINGVGFTINAECILGTTNGKFKIEYQYY